MQENYTTHKHTYTSYSYVVFKKDVSHVVFYQKGCLLRVNNLC